MVAPQLDAWFAEFRRNADPQRLAAVFDATAPELLRVARHLANDAHAAEDLVQATFLKAIENRDRYDPALPVLPWLLGILSNQARHERRRGGRALPPAIAGAADSAAEVAESEERCTMLHDALRGLPEPYRQVLLLRVDHGLDSRAIAEVTGRKPATVRTQIARGMDLLRAALPVGSAVGLVSVPVGATVGLGAVRATVLQCAGALTGASGTLAATALGGWMMKQIAVVAGCLLLLASAWWWFAEPESVFEPAQTPSAAVSSAVTDAPTSRVSGAAASIDVSDPPVREPVSIGAMAMVRVTVLGGDGAAVPEVGVYLAGELLRPFGRDGITNDAGAVTFDRVPVGPLIVKPDRGPGVPCTVVAGLNEIQIRLPAGIEVEGRVTDPSGQIAIPHATIFALSREHHERAQRLAEADAEGAFRLVAVAAGVHLFARAPGWQPGDPKRQSVATTTKSPLRLELHVGARAHELRGRVTTTDGMPAAFAQIAIAVDEDARKFRDGLRGRAGGWQRQRDVEAFLLRADADGAFTTDEVPEGEAIVLARAAAGQPPGVALVAVVVTAGSENRRDIVLQAGATLHGTVRDESGRPYAGMPLLTEWMGTDSISFEGGFGKALACVEGVTDEHGNYQLQGLLAGEHDVYARAALRANLRYDPPDPQNNVVTLVAGETRRLDLVVPRRGDLAVRLLAPDGQPLTGWGVWASVERAPTPRMNQLEAQRTDTDGCVRVTQLLRGTALCVSVFAPRPPAAGDRLIDRFPARQWQDVYVHDDELVLQLGQDDLPTGAIAARLVDPHGAPLTRARGELWRDSWLERRRFDVPDGLVAMTGLPAGRYWIQLSGSGSPCLGPFALAPGQDLDLGALTVAEPGGLRVVLRTVDGGAITTPDGRLCLPGPAGRRMDVGLQWKNGALVVENKPPGPYQLVVWAADLAPSEHTVEVCAGKVNEVQLDCPRGYAQPFAVAVPGFVEPSEPGGWIVDVEVFDAVGVRVGGVRSCTPQFTLRLRRGSWTVRWQLPGGQTESAVCTLVADHPAPPIMLRSVTR